jgi:hypothetical protein
MTEYAETLRTWLVHLAEREPTISETRCDAVARGVLQRVIEGDLSMFWTISILTT